MGVDSNNRLRDQIKSKIAWPNVADEDKHTYLGVLTRTGDVGVSLNSYSGECLGNLDNCPNGLSLSFWMNYNGKRRGLFFCAFSRFSDLFNELFIQELFDFL